MEEQYTKAFNLWASRYCEDPNSFDEILDKDGNVIDNYGIRCAVYFNKLLEEVK